MVDPPINELLNYGILGLSLVLIFLGWLEPKPAIDERKAREKAKDELIKELTVALNRLADRHEARQ